MMRKTWVVVALGCGFVPTLGAQANPASSHLPSTGSAEGRRLTADGQSDSFRRAVVHGGKWFTALTSAAFIMFAEREHNQSRRTWNSLLDICRSAQDACAVGPDGRYVRSDAEQLYQRSRAFDRRANHWLLGAQASLLATTALFIIDLHPGEGPDNIPYPSEIRVGSVGGGAGVELRLAF